MSDFTSYMQAELEHCISEHASLASCPGLKNRCLGLENSDRRLWQLGQQWLLHHGHAITPATRGSHEGPDVYLATQLYAAGGHTPLIGDFVRALQDADETKPPPHLVITHFHSDSNGPVPETIIQRTAIAQEHVHVIPKSSLAEKLGHLFETLIRLKPARLFLFHHPGDPLPVAATQHAIAQQHVLVHHADAMPSFGLYLTGIVLIDLHFTAAAMTRLQGLRPRLLPLTCPDPGLKVERFLKHGCLVTASSGSSHKYRVPYHLTYAETVALILQTTGGKHIHIGPLEDSDLNTIHEALRRRSVSPEKFVHVPWTASVAKTLWEYACDLYVSSFPINGARTNAEVLAAGIPHLSHSLNPDHNIQSYELSIEGGLVWKDWAELIQHLQEVSHPEVLEEKSRQSRATYERVHHPKVFTSLLKNILDGAEGWHDSRELQNEQQAVRSLFKSVTQALLQQRRLMEDAKRQRAHEKEQNLKRFENLKGKISSHQSKQKKLTKYKLKIINPWKKLINKLRGK